MTTLENKLAGWIGPSSSTEQEKQERTERMIRQAISSHPAFNDCSLTVFTKGSYANNTNVRADSDVDIAVQCHEARYSRAASPDARSASAPYSGIWTPDKLRSELTTALRARFPGAVDISGSTALRVDSNTARVEADVVPCFDFRYYFAAGGYREGTKVFKTNGDGVENYPVQQLENGRAKNTRTNQRYKKTVRIMKRLENEMVRHDVHGEVPSFFVECLVYNVPDKYLMRATWTDTVRGVLGHIYQELDGVEPSGQQSGRWREVSRCKYLFTPQQKWTRDDARSFAKAAWNHLGYK
ncbi:hypothetical protein GCM10027059_45780 [Myceligenerans halotolerans]